MGYRSEVYMAVRGPRDILVAEFVKFELDPDPVMKTCLKEWILQPVNIGGEIEVLATLHGENWKWYQEYADVQTHEEIFHTFWEISDNRDDESPVKNTLCGTFLRIGEEDHDIKSETFGDKGFELANISRSIQMEYARDGSNEIRPTHQGDEAERQADVQAAREALAKTIAEHKVKVAIEAAHSDPQLELLPPG